MGLRKTCRNLAESHVVRNGNTCRPHSFVSFNFSKLCRFWLPLISSRKPFARLWRINEYRIQNTDLLPSAVGIRSSECGAGTESMIGERRESKKAIGERGHILQQRDGVRFGTGQRGPGTYRTGENPAGKGRLFFEWVRKFPDSVDRKGLRGHLSEKLIQKIKPINILLYIG